MQNMYARKKLRYTSQHYFLSPPHGRTAPNRSFNKRFLLKTPLLKVIPLQATPLARNRQGRHIVTYCPKLLTSSKHPYLGIINVAYVHM